MADGGSGGGIAVAAPPMGEAVSSAACRRRARRPTTKRPHPAVPGRPGYVEHGLWVTWDPAVAARPLRGMPQPGPSSDAGQANLGGPAVRHQRSRRSALCHGRAETRVSPPSDRGVIPVSNPPPASAVSTVSAVTPPRVQTGEPSSPTKAAQRRQRRRDDRDAGRADIALMQRQLHLLSQLEWIPHDPGTIDGKLGPHTARSLSAFQRAYGPGSQRPPDGVVVGAAGSHLSVGARRSTGSPVCRQRGSGAKELCRPLDDEPVAAVYLYFRHGAARAGDRISVIAHGALPLHRFRWSCTMPIAASRCLTSRCSPPSRWGTGRGDDDRAQRRSGHAPDGSGPGQAQRGALRVVAGGLRQRCPSPSAALTVARPGVSCRGWEAGIAEVLLGRRALSELAAELTIERDALLRLSLRYSEAGRRALQGELATRGLQVKSGTGDVPSPRSFSDGDDSRPARIQRPFGQRPAPRQRRPLRLLRRRSRADSLHRTRGTAPADSPDLQRRHHRLPAQRRSADLGSRTRVAAGAGGDGAAGKRGDLRGIRAPAESRGEVQIRLGNHDAELALPEVQAVLRAALRQPWPSPPR